MFQSLYSNNIEVTVNGNSYFCLDIIQTAQLLRLAREAAGLELEEASILLGMDKDYLEEIEIGFVGLVPEMIDDILGTYSSVALDELEDEDEASCEAESQADEVAEKVC